jgi:hypothetical protein
LHPAMATPNLMVVEMLPIEWDPMVKSRRGTSTPFAIGCGVAPGACTR